MMLPCKEFSFITKLKEVFMKQLLGVLFVALIGYVLIRHAYSYASNSSSESVATTIKDVQSVPAICTLSVRKLGFIYANNAIAADKRYEHKVFDILGVIETVDYDITGCPYVHLTAGNCTSAGCPHDAVCYFDRGYKETIATLSKGQRVMIKGECHGLTIGSVRFYDCCF